MEDTWLVGPVQLCFYISALHSGTEQSVSMFSYGNRINRWIFNKRWRQACTLQKQCCQSGLYLNAGKDIVEREKSSFT